MSAESAGFPDPEQPKQERKRERAGMTPRQIEKAMAETIEAVAGFVYMTGDEYCAGILSDRADQLAEAYARLAERNKAVRRFLTAMLTGSDWSQVIVLTAGTLLPIAAHHDWLPPDLFGIGLVPTPPSEEVAAHQARATQAEPVVPPPPAPEPAGAVPAEAVPGEEAAEPPPPPPEGKVTEVGDQGGEARPVTDEPGEPPA